MPFFQLFLQRFRDRFLSPSIPLSTRQSILLSIRPSLPSVIHQFLRHSSIHMSVEICFLIFLPFWHFRLSWVCYPICSSLPTVSLVSLFLHPPSYLHLFHSFVCSIPSSIPASVPRADFCLAVICLCVWLLVSRCVQSCL